MRRIYSHDGRGPRQCGIATFTPDLCEAMAAEYSGMTCIALPVNDTEDGYAYPPRVRFELTEKDIDSYRRAADAALAAGRRRMLFGMTTGTGKTLTIAMLIKRWFQAGLISRVLFLADRIELGRQAKQDTFDDYLAHGPGILLYGGKHSLEGQIVGRLWSR
jgi:superfamily II DNA or RNA helicase